MAYQHGPVRGRKSRSILTWEAAESFTRCSNRLMTKFTRALTAILKTHC